jgi:hypothetical protein
LVMPRLTLVDPPYRVNSLSPIAPPGAGRAHRMNSTASLPDSTPLPQRFTSVEGLEVLGRRLAR